ncbi:ankyrin repeat and zinc finger domain-containing protein 1 isoform X1 [Chanos chanos]|uniref:Ankyrin repeat and zinc finger domain-containing protein 1 isoform X1 n=1 Tax=Chanos chanos TaxID=29144 RepID=A0A6J2WE70_CHACN|nr:ankyrin repeat and zinc finger domain-containing protein 1 isoform X1 [Chanos chanos]
MFRCMVQKPSLSDEEDPVASLLNITPKTMWIILMTGGGHFAGAVYQGKEVLQHKTFHRYTVRAKRGTAQGLRDSQNRSHAPKSAGAALRRYNEAALVKDIQDLLESWSEHLKVACAIFLRAPSYNKSIFFGGRAAPLDKKDPRVRVIPFATRRATFREVKRVHEVLSTVQVYEKDVEVSSIFSPSKKAWQRKARKPVAETNPEQDVATPAGEREEEGSSGEDSPATQLETVELTLGTLHLREHEVYLNKKKQRRRKEKSRAEREESSHKGRDPSAEETEAAEPEHGVSGESRGKVKGRRKPKNKKQQLEEDGADDSREYGIRDALYTACKTGDVDTLRALLKLPGPVDEERAENDAREPGAPGVSETATPRSILNKPIDSSGFTLLHVAAAAGQKAVVTLLMDAGSDPASRDNKGQTPYGVAPEKDTRNTFRKYMAENPKKYDYTKAQVPGPLTAEIEAKKAEKKKAQKAAKKQREKEQKEEKQKKELEKEERKRFAALSDREKRALAAERRLAEQMATTEVTIANIRRCWLCGESLLGKVPFHYLDYSFCSPRCVQAHRKASAPAAKP